ncbi:MAG: hypothetical protein ACRC2J_17130, partial [Microcoleaceae cyanobacterium]
MTFLRENVPSHNLNTEVGDAQPPPNLMKIVLENIHKCYGKRTVVSRVNLSVAQGEIVGLLGP